MSMQLYKITLFGIDNLLDQLRESTESFTEKVFQVIGDRTAVSYSFEIKVEDFNFAYLSNLYCCFIDKTKNENSFPTSTLLCGSKAFNYQYQEFDYHKLMHVPFQEVESLIKQLNEINLETKLEEVNLEIGKWMKQDSGLLYLDEMYIAEEKQKLEELKVFYNKVLEHKEDVVCILEYA
ncbi:MAG: hypothetical protein AB6733_24665 [Clostridiaceae bacterium]